LLGRLFFARLQPERAPGPPHEFATARPYADPEKAARRILEIANTVEPSTSRRSTSRFYSVTGGSPAEYGAGLKLDRTRLAQDARVRDFRHLYASGRGVVA
jgi:hypothetical protein